MAVASYPKIWNLGHPRLVDLLKDPLVIQEKIDGSQFSFLELSDGIQCRSKNVQINLDSPDMFKEAVASVRAFDLAAVRKVFGLPYGTIFRGEFLKKPKHNTLAYERVPKRHLVLYDVDIGESTYLPPDRVELIAHALGIEHAPVYYVGQVESLEKLEELCKGFLDKRSLLGDSVPIEGVVVKNYFQFMPDGKSVMAKYVSEGFREKHSKDYKASNPSQSMIIERLSQELASPERWIKAVHAMRDSGELQREPRDIGKLIGIVKGDVLDEETEYIKDQLFKWAYPQISRRMVGGFAEWYKEWLLGEAKNEE